MTSLPNAVLSSFTLHCGGRSRPGSAGHKQEPRSVVELDCAGIRSWNSHGRFSEPPLRAVGAGHWPGAGPGAKKDEFAAFTLYIAEPAVAGGCESHIGEALEFETVVACSVIAKALARPRGSRCIGCGLGRIRSGSVVGREQMKHAFVQRNGAINDRPALDGKARDRDDWERNARHIITFWGPPVNDYSCRVWSGLTRDFYVPGLKAMAAGESFDRRAWEAGWGNSLGISPCSPLSPIRLTSRRPGESGVR